MSRSQTTASLPDTSRLSPFAQQALRRHPVRKSKAQKAAFREDLTQVLQTAGWQVQTQHSGRFIQNNNVVAGDVRTARLVLTAHYDTPAVLPFPNFLAPRNLLVSLVYQLAVALVLVALPFLAVWLLGSGLGLLFPGFVLHPLADLLLTWVLLAGMLFLILAGPANRSNVNDNTSGVLTLAEVAQALPPHLRGEVALVFFDNEELGLVGSTLFRKQYGTLPHTPLLNFDCVSDGDTLLFVLPTSCRRDAVLVEQLRTCFQGDGEKRVELQTKGIAFYPSDQVGFARGIAVAAFNKAPLVGLYVARIHTRRDTVLQQQNLLLLRDGVLRMAARIAPQQPVSA